MQPQKQIELKKWEAFVFKSKEKLPPSKSTSGSGRQSCEKGIQTERDPCPNQLPGPRYGLSKLSVPTTRLHTIFNVPSKRPGPGLDSINQHSVNNASSIDSDGSKRPKLSKSANAKEERNNRKEKLDLQNLPSFQTALDALV